MKKHVIDKIYKKIAHTGDLNGIINTGKDYYDNDFYDDAIRV
jgi:hypothetical protein